MEKRILIIIYTHGDEKIGKEVVKGLKKKKLGRFFDCLIANPEAARKNLRFIKADLNRSYPGKVYSKVYERRLAYNNLEIAKKYQFVIDIHEATSGISDFIIIPRKIGKIFFPIDLVDLDTVLFWPNPKGALGQFLYNSIELEFGTKMKNRKKAVLKAERIVAGFIKKIYSGAAKGKKSKKKFYYVYGKIVFEDFTGNCKKLKDFKKTVMRSESFYPLLVGQYIKNGIICYKMKRF